MTGAKTTITQLTFYGNKLCPFARRAWLVISELGVPHDYVTIPLAGELTKARGEAGGIDSLANWRKGNPDGNVQAGSGEPHTADSLAALKDWFKDQVHAAGLGSSATVPTIRVRYADGAVAWIAEADVVSEFLIDAFPDRSEGMMPTDALARARVRDVYKALCNSTGVSAMYGALKNADPALDVEKRDAMYSFFERFSTLADPTGPFFSGPAPGFLDFMLAPFFDRFRNCLPYYRGLELIPSDTTTYPWAKRMQQWATAIDETVESFNGVTQIPPEMHIKLYEIFGKVRREFGKPPQAE